MSADESHPQWREVPRIHIVGRKNAGKTTLVCELVRELSRRGFRVATVKHTHHNHELDTPGKDSHQHRASGAAGVGILSPHMAAAFVPSPKDDADGYACFNIMFNSCDVILVEGDLQTAAPKIEVWRATTDAPPYATDDETMAAVVTDDAATVCCDILPRCTLEAVTARVLELSGL
jgi:molybdopterin-guanine dinucleotide biosynthesis protein B